MVFKYFTLVLLVYTANNVMAAENSEPADQIASDSFRPDTQEFGNFRQIGEIILELEQAYPSNSFANINKGFSPVDGRFGPESNFTRAVADSTVRVVGGQDQQTLPQSESSSGYADPDGVLAGIIQPQDQMNNVTGIQFLTAEDIEQIERGKRGALDLAQIIKCSTGCDPLLFQGYGCFCGFLGSGEPVDGIDTCCKMHDWCYTTSNCMGLNYDLPYFVPFKWKCNGGAPYCIPGKSEKTGRNSCSHQLCECDREFSMCLKRYLPCPTSKAVCKKSPQRLIQNVGMGMASGKGIHHPKPSKPTYKAVPRYDERYSGRPSINLPNLHLG